MKQKIIIIVLLLSVAFSASLRPARADYWGATNGAAYLKETMEEMYIQIKETIIANLKMAAVKIVMGRIQTLLTGSAGSYGAGGGSLVITDWQDFIYGTAQKYSMAITNDFFTTVSSGVSSTLKSRVLDPAEKLVKGDSASSTSVPKPDLDKYVSEGKGENIFKSGSFSKNWTGFNAAAMPQNSIEAYYLSGKWRQDEAFRQKEEQKIAEAIAGGGYKPVSSSSSSKASQAGGSNAGKYGEVGYGSEAEGYDETVKTPASSVKSLTDTVAAMPIRILEAAKSIPEVVTAMVTNMITQMINQGIAKVTEPIDNTLRGYSLSQMQSNIQSGINSSLNK
ncbi:MAG: hypothetical protein Q8L09_04885 [Candidatus Moranbacteria bacterium]|nr:hypothetical protein [Candidatus Moranbacteria bacterium]